MKNTRFYINKTRFGCLALIACSAMWFQNCVGSFAIPFSTTQSSLSAQAAEVPTGQVRRLSMTEYRNSLNDILTYQFARINAGNAWAGGITVGDDPVSNSLSAMPSDTSPTKLSSPELAMAVTDDLFAGYTSVATAVAGDILTNNRLQNFIGCATDDATMDPTCVDQFITDFGTLAFRTPPTASERADLKSGTTTWTGLIARILAHPRFLTHYERDGVLQSDGSYQLTPYEIEARMAAVFLKSIPDVTGLQVAASGTLATASGRRTEATRLLGLQRAKDVMWTFYQQWLGASRVPFAYGSDEAAYDAFSAPFVSSDLNQNNALFRGAVLDDAHQFLEYHTFTNGGSLSDIFRSTLIFTTDSRVASIYGVTARANTSAGAVTDTSGHYAGILSRQIITQQNPGSEGDTNHIQRGVILLTNIAGMPLGPPAATALQQAAAVNVPEGASTRVQAVMQTSATSCQSCHQSINPSGFALAHFDSLGRYQTTEKRYRLVNSAAAIVASNTIDSQTYVPFNGTYYSVNSVSTLVDALFNSGVVYTGFSKYYFQFAFGRTATTSSDILLLTNMTSDLRTKSIMETLLDLTQQTAFTIATPPRN